MEDGTVKYVKLYKQHEISNTDCIYYILNANINYLGRTLEFTSNGSLSSVSEVIKLYIIETYSQNTSGYKTVISATKKA